MSLKSTLPEPIKNAKIDQDAKWLAGEGAGSWFVIRLFSSNLYEIERLSPDGESECKGFFLLATEEVFDINAEFELVFISHCEEVRVIQGTNLLLFRLVANG